MEFYGSIASVSGSITASLFTGSFKGDGGSLYNLPASGVTGLNLSQIASGNATASISSTGFTVNKSTQIQGDLSVTGSIIATNYIVSSSVTYMTTSFASGSSMFGNDGNDVHQFTGSVQITGSITLNGQAIGTGKLDETTFQSYTSSISSSIGSLSASIALTDVSQSNRITNIENTFATTGSNLFKGNQTISGSIIPAVSASYDLGSVSYPFRHLYLSSASLYVNGTKVLGSTAQELQITTDNGQSFKILEAGSDTITLQSADGDIQLKASGGGNVLLDPTTGLIDLRGTIQVQDSNKIRSSGGTQVVFGDDVEITGSLRLTGTIQGVNLLNFSSSVSASISSLLGGNASLSSSIATTTSGLSSSIGSLSSSVATTTSGLSSSIGSLSSSIATTTLNLKNRVDSIETSTGSLNSFTSSINTTIKSKLNSESVISGSVQIDITSTTNYTTFSSSISSSFGFLSSSVATTTSGLSSSIGSLSSSIATTTLGTKNRVDSIETTTGSLNTFTSSASGRLTSLETASGSIRTDFNTYTGSNNTTNTTQNGRLDSLETASGSIRTTLNTYTSSNDSTNTTQNSRLTSIEGVTGSISSLNTFTSSINTTIKTKLDSESVISGSAQVIITGTTGYSTFSSSVSTSIGALSSSVAITTSGLSSSIGSLSSSVATTTLGLSSSIGSLSSSVATTTVGTKNRVDSIESKTGSYATTGSNIFQGNQTITGSLYISQNLIVAGSSSIQYITSSQLTIGDNIISLNANAPALRFSGLEVIDSGSSPQVSGSLLFDSVDNEWIFVHQATNAAALTSSTVITGPETINNLGNETHLTDNRIPKTISGFHIIDSNITDNGTKVSINSSTEITGSVIATGGITSNGVLISNMSSGDEGGEIQLAKPQTNSTISGTAVIIDIWQNRLRFFEGGGSSRGAFLDIPTLSAGVGTNLLGTASTASYVEFSNVANKPTLVSGSSQITFSGISGLPTLVSGSSQITFGSISSIPSGLVSGSSQITFGSVSGVPSGLVSGSSQISFGSVSGIPSGLVSGSSQITLSSTTGYGSVLNQAVLTTSSPTFGGMTLTGALGGTSATFSGNVTINGTVIGTDQTFGGAYRTFAFGTNSNGFNRIFAANDTSDGLYLNAATGRGIYFRVNGGGTDVVSISSAGAVTLTGTISASNFSGTSSGTNTGDQTSVSGNAGTVTNGVYTSGDQTISGIKTFSNRVVFNSSVTNRPQLPGGMLGLDTGDGNFDIWGISRDYYPSHATAANAWGLRWNGDNNDFEFVGGGTNRVILDMDGGNITNTGNILATGTISASNFSGTHSGTSSGTNTGDQTNISGNAATATTATNLYGPGGSYIASSNGTKSYSTSIQIREAGLGGAQASNMTYAPRLGFHWSGVVASSIAMEASGRIGIFNNPGTSYENFVAETIYANSSFQGNLTGNVTGNVSGTASNITAYTINQSVGSSNAPTFAGITLSGPLYRNAAGTGYLSGNYSSSETGSSTGAIYTIGGSYYPTSTSLNNMYGIGYTNISGNVSMTSATGWGMYVAANGTPYVWLGAEGNASVFRGNILPHSNNSYNLGSASYGWANVYTNDLHLSNMNKPEGNDIDGTNGNWTIQEGAENLYIINNNNGKKFKIKLEEI